MVVVPFEDIFDRLPRHRQAAINRRSKEVIEENTMLCQTSARESDQKYRVIAVSGRNTVASADTDDEADMNRIFDMFVSDPNVRMVLGLWREKARMVREFIRQPAATKAEGESP